MIAFSECEIAFKALRTFNLERETLLCDSLVALKWSIEIRRIELMTTNQCRRKRGVHIKLWENMRAII